MSWTTPGTATTGGTATAAFWNAQVRDNFNVTAVSAATAAGDLAYAAGANDMTSILAHPGSSQMLVSAASNALAWRQPVESINWSSGGVSTSTSTTYTSTDDAATGTLPSVTVTTGTLALVMVSCHYVSNSTANARCFVSYSISGATSGSAGDSTAARFESDSTGQQGSVSVLRAPSLTAGSNTFQMEVKVSAGTGTFAYPRILVIPF